MSRLGRDPPQDVLEQEGIEAHRAPGRLGNEPLNHSGWRWLNEIGAGQPIRAGQNPCVCGVHVWRVGGPHSRRSRAYPAHQRSETRGYVSPSGGFDTNPGCAQGNHGCPWLLAAGSLATCPGRLPRFSQRPSQGR
jgi:hypothetical protein